MTGPGRVHGGEPWWEGFFDEDFATLWLTDEVPATSARRAEGLLGVLGLEPGDRLFDQCCGVGRVAAPLVARGVHVEGVDACAPYVRRAWARCDALPRAGRGEFCFVRGDAFGYVPSEPCHAAINWHTSFGYVPDDARNLEMLRAAHGALRARGLFVLDYPDMDRVRAEFRPLLERTRQTPAGQYRAVREAQLDGARDMLVDRWTFFGPDGRRRVCGGETRLYSRVQLRGLLVEAGFEVLGEVAPHEVGYQPGDGRCIWLARRAEVDTHLRGHDAAPRDDSGAGAPS